MRVSNITYFIRLIIVFQRAKHDFIAKLMRLNSLKMSNLTAIHTINKKITILILKINRPKPKSQLIMKHH